ncbi:MAG: type II secretion system F family protein, partial [Gammaproteobacteria bacterium]|nr:type II secretion system F family protein [Gammaproteobacteria bacterium]
MATASAPDAILFLWEGVDRKGTRIKGEAQATNEILLKADLRRQGISPLKVKKKPKPLFGGKKIVSKDISIFARMLATMLNAGVPLVQSFEIIGRG